MKKISKYVILLVCLTIISCGERFNVGQKVTVSKRMWASENNEDTYDRLQEIGDNKDWYGLDKMKKRGEITVLYVGSTYTCKKVCYNHIHVEDYSGEIFIAPKQAFEKRKISKLQRDYKAKHGRYYHRN